jgi:hypothetical protein
LVDVQSTEGSGVGNFNEQVWGELRERRQFAGNGSGHRLVEQFHAGLEVSLANEDLSQMATCH